MKKIKLTVLSIFLTLTVFAQSPTAPALGFNVFLENGATLKTNETEGPMALGGDVTLTGSYNVGTHSIGRYQMNNTTISMVIGGKVNYASGNNLQILQGGYIKIGDSTGSYVWYKDPNNASSNIRITPGANYNGSPRIELHRNAIHFGNVSSTNNPIFEKTPINFASAFTQLRANAAAIATLPANASLTNPNGNPIPHTGLPQQVKINLNNGINVLNITGADLNACQNFTYNQQPDANKVLIINVNAPGNFNWNVWNQAGFGGLTNCQYIFYNFYNTTKLTLQTSNAVEGTIFAPNADIVKIAHQGNIQGQVIAKSFIHEGGEVHYAEFTTSILPTVAAFTVNKQTQCLTGNSFSFTNTSTGGGTLSYQWNFGDGTSSTQANPTKTYATAGTYTVTLTTTGNLGSNNSTLNLTVTPAVTKGFTLNSREQELNNNEYKFITTNPNGAYTYSWDFGDGTSSTDVNPTKVYTFAGSFDVVQTVSNGGCSDTHTETVLVCSDSVSPGNGGGLESESLGDAISKREFNRAKNNFNPYINYANEPMFTHKRVYGKKADIKLADLFPTSLTQGDAVRVSTPQDLLELTIASEVLGLDYTVNNKAKAVVLGIKTLGRAYNHTKSICDRLRGATLIKVESVTIKGYEFVQFALRQDNGVVEYAIAFVIGKQNGQAAYSLQSNWLISSFANQDAFYNMQVWSTLPQHTHKLVGDIIDNIKAENTLQQINTNAAPVVYTTKGTRNQQNLVLDIVNNTANTSAVLKFDQRLTETADYTEFEMPITLNPNGVTSISVPVKDAYEYEMGLFINGEKMDEAYLADGNWSLDYDKANTTIDLFDIKNEQNRDYTANEYSIYRAIHLTATTDDYVTLYKPIRAGAIATDLSSYEYLEFTAKGTGKLNVRLNTASIIKWDEQYNTTITLSDEAKVYTIPFKNFKSSRTNAVMNPKDAKMLVFNIEFQQGISTYNLEMSSIKFGKSSTGLFNRESTQTAVSAYPNPNNGNFEIQFNASKFETAEIVITDIVGKVISTQTVNIYSGNNTLNIALPNEAKGLMFINIKSANETFATQKVLVK